MYIFIYNSPPFAHISKVYPSRVMAEKECRNYLWDVLKMKGLTARASSSIEDLNKVIWKNDPRILGAHVQLLIPDQEFLPRLKFIKNCDNTVRPVERS